jgi:hypothetical protein
MSRPPALPPATAAPTASLPASATRSTSVRTSFSSDSASIDAARVFRADETAMLLDHLADGRLHEVVTDGRSHADTHAADATPSEWEQPRVDGGQRSPLEFPGWACPQEGGRRSAAGGESAWLGRGGVGANGWQGRKTTRGRSSCADRRRVEVSAASSSSRSARPSFRPNAWKRRRIRPSHSSSVMAPNILRSIQSASSSLDAARQRSANSSSSCDLCVSESTIWRSSPPRPPAPPK